MKLRVATVAGELSGDRLGGSLLRGLAARNDLEVVGVGGPEMRAAGLTPLADFDRLGINGFIQPVLRLPELVGLLLRLRRDILRSRPDVFVGIDFNVFNLLLARLLRRAGLPTVHYVSPSVYAWRRGRIRGIARAVDLMLALYPFEPPLYAGHGMRAVFVGHPLADEIAWCPDAAPARERLGLSTNGPVVALLPGSRSAELKALGVDFVRAAALLHERHPGLEVVVPLARKAFEGPLRTLFATHAAGVRLQLSDAPAHEVMAAADVVLAKSGTCTLEAALVGRPMVVAYRLGPVSYRIVRRLMHGDHVALPNILAGRALVPELLQDDVTPQALADAVDDVRTRWQGSPDLAEAFRSLGTTLRRDAGARAAEAVLELVRSRAAS